MAEDSSLLGDSSMHTGQEPAPGGGFFLHRMTIRFTSGEIFAYIVREPLHAEDIPAAARFAVIHSYMCEPEGKCTEIILVNLNDISYIRTEHITGEDLKREEEMKSEHRTIGVHQPLSHIGFI
ncbi:MAG TPA: hypothetical protein VK619_02745 [Pyrinomonadaceae bacterium]|nr:hypothetical protein [Pyrinomonadaceae bacterium]